MNQYATSENTIESFVCFRKFIDFLEHKVKDDNGSSTYFYQFVLDKIQLFPQLSQYVNITKMENYDEILDLVASIVFPLTDDEDEVLMALTNAASPEAFYTTNAFHRLFQPAPGSDISQPWVDENALLEIHKQFQYNLILKKIYGYGLPERKEMVHSFFHPFTRLYKYYRLNFDTRFVEVKPKNEIEKVSSQQINSCFLCSNPLGKIERVLFLDHYTASGFSILTLTDITAQQAVEQIGKALVNINQENTDNVFLHITRLLQTILGSSDYQFGIMPFFTINKRAALPYENFFYSILIRASVKAAITKSVFNRYMSHYLENPDWIIYNSSNNHSTLPVDMQNALNAAGVYYYSMAPVFFNNQLVGILEIGAAQHVAPLNEFQASRLKPAMPYLSQLMKLLIEKFNTSIDTIVKDKFTNIQPSVQWKFNEVAWHYFRSHDIEHKDTALEKVFFKEVYPLYGAIDIRNSTIERNKALREDLEFQLQSLISLLNGLYENKAGDQYLILSDACVQWLEKMQTYVSVEEELQLNDFLYSQVHPLLLSADHLSNPLLPDIQAYLKSIDEVTVQAFKKRRQLENAQMLNGVIGKYFDLFNDELQINYPCYFEKFRTDGIEYDIYIGQSIAPSLPFSLMHLDKLRLWQLQSMAAITKLTHYIQPQLDYYLQTTQLIFVNGRTIDISFRNDERRFDVEGAYNIRYHIVKKRIDKVHIRNTDERLTQPGKIAMVYLNEKDAVPYLEIIHQLQEKQILLNDLEMLSLEDLQGVSGLKAWRVGVVLENDNNSMPFS